MLFLGQVQILYFFKLTEFIKKYLTIFILKIFNKEQHCKKTRLDFFFHNLLKQYFPVLLHILEKEHSSMVGGFMDEYKYGESPEACGFQFLSFG